MGRRILSVLLLVGALVLWFAWITGRLHQPFVLTVGVLLFVAGGLLFPKTYEVVQRIHPLIGKKVVTEAWERDLPEYSGATFRFHRALAFGAGLHLYLAPLTGSKAIHLKIAQPRDVIINETGVEIGNAKYVQWQGRKIKRIAGTKALVLRMV